MASYHFKMNIGVKGKGEPHSLYICREGKYATKDSRYEDLVYKEHQSMPAWAAEPREFWAAADEYERANGRSYREFEIALPNELTTEQQIELVKSFAHDTLGQDYPYSFAIHNKDAALKKGVKQPHAHIMFSERRLDGIERSKDQFFKRANSKNPERGGVKKDEIWIKEETLVRLRETWAIYQNRTLEKYGHEVRVDHRSLEAQKNEALDRGDYRKAEELDRPAETHLGPKTVQRISKTAREQIRPAKTAEEREKRRDEYYQKVEQNEKARKVHNIREYRRTVQAIEQEKGRIPENSLYRYDFRLKEINIRLNRLLSERQQLSQKVLTPERAEWIAQSVYLKKQALNESQPKLGTPAANTHIEKIKAAVLKKNKPYRELLESLDKEIQSLRNERDEVKQERAAKREEIKAERRTIEGPERYRNQDAYEKLNRSVNELNQNRENRGALAARILVEDDREKDMER